MSTDLDLKKVVLHLGQTEREMLLALADAWAPPGTPSNRAAAARRAIREAYARMEKTQKKSG